ncbi:ATP-binding protein [Streptomyces sp. NPDC014733]|uniref:ATP-binding protein n=1 Tax=Streptomyces sp. NPDC014733 TaxID=3364885 RepID=UPI0036F85BBD
MGDEEVIDASRPDGVTAPGYAPHPYVGGRTPVLRALAAWRMSWPGAPRVIALTGAPGSGRGRLLTGFLMLCDPESRNGLPVDELDPATVPPDLPAPAVPDPGGLTAAQFLRTAADHLGLAATRPADLVTELGAREEPVTLVVPDVAAAGPVRAAGEPARLVREVLAPLAALPAVQLLAVVPRELAAELTAAVPRGQAQIIDLDAPEWADPDGLVAHAATALDPARGAPALPFTTDPQPRAALAAALGARAAGSHLTVELAVRSALLAPEGFDPADPEQLPATVGQAVDLHARRLGADPRLLRLLLAPLALAEGEGLPLPLWGALASAVAERDLGRELTDGALLTAPFVDRVEAPSDAGDGVDGRSLIRLVHPALAAEIRERLPDVRGAQTRIAMRLLEAVPDQDWSRADPYVRDRLAGHTLDAGLLPQLLTDPGLFAHADPVALRAAVEAVPLQELGAPARTYLRTAPLLTRTRAAPALRAAFLETAFTEDGLRPYAQALHGLGLALPWRTLWSLPPAGATAVATGVLPGGPVPVPVAVCRVPAATPGARALPGGDGACVVHALADGAPLDAAPEQVVHPSAEEHAAAPFTLTRGDDGVRVHDRRTQEVVAAVPADSPVLGADLSPDGVLLLTTERGVTARQILAAMSAAPPRSGADGGSAPRGPRGR